MSNDLVVGRAVVLTPEPLCNRPPGDYVVPGTFRINGTALAEYLAGAKPVTVIQGGTIPPDVLEAHAARRARFEALVDAYGEACADVAHAMERGVGDDLPKAQEAREVTREALLSVIPMWK